MVGPLPLLMALVAGALVLGAEYYHLRRVGRLGRLAFGAGLAPAPWTACVPWLRSFAAAALAWSFTVLLLLPPKVHEGSPTVSPAEIRHIVIVLDVSPSMKLQDSGPKLDESRAKRAASLLESFFQRVPMERVRLSVIATYNGAKPVVVDTRDVAVVRNILNDLPMSHAFEAGPTKIFDGIAEAARIGQPWKRHSASLVVVTDGDTLPPTGMPVLPFSYHESVVIGVGDTRTSKFIDGHQSRQEATTLRELATRLKGNYHDGNQKHLPSALLNQLVAGEEQSAFEKLTLREYALILASLGALILSLLEPLLRRFGVAATHAWSAENVAGEDKRKAS